MKNVDIDLLRVFVAVHQFGGFSHAAKQLNRLQSSVSQQIKKLEDIVGAQLFIRDKRNVALSPEGEILLEYAGRMINLNDEILGRINTSDLSGDVRIGVPEAFAAYHLPDILLRFKKAHPDINIEIVCDFSSNLIEQYNNGQLDFILFKRSHETQNLGTRVWQESLIWVGQNNAAYDQNQALPIILSPEPCVYREKTLKFLEGNKLNWRCVYTSASITGRIAAARAGLGITIVPKELLAITHNLYAIDSLTHLPALKKIEIALDMPNNTFSDSALLLAEHIIFCLKNDPSIKTYTNRVA